MSYSRSHDYVAIVGSDLLPTDSRVVVRSNGDVVICHYYLDGRYPSHCDVIGEIPDDMPVYIAAADCPECGGKGEVRRGSYVPCHCLREVSHVESIEIEGDYELD